MESSEVTPATLVAIVRDPARLAALLGAINAETGSPIPLTKAAANAAQACVATAEELEEVFDLLVPADTENLVLDWLAFHPGLPEHCLFELLDTGRCIQSLGHRRGPEGLLLRVVAQHPDVEEAILTLALCHYGPDPQRRDRFLEFVREHLHSSWLRESLRRSDLAAHIPRDRLIIAIDLANDYERGRS